MNSIVKSFACAMLCTVLLAGGGCAAGPDGTIKPPEATPAVQVEQGGDAPDPAGAEETQFPTQSPAGEPAGDIEGDIEAQIYFINVGKADSALVYAGGGYYLIDTGTKDSYSALKRALGDIGVKELAGVFITHSHDDHMGGLKKLAEDIPIRMLYCAQISEPNKKGEHRIVKRAEKLDIPYTLLCTGEAVDGLFSVLGPVELNGDDDNDNSLVLMLEVCGVRALFTGDMQFPEEDTLLSAGADVRADILKVGNHGNPDATGDGFAQAVAPGYAVISTDTAEDTDSANIRVQEALDMAQIFVTEDADMYVLAEIYAGGAVRFSVH